MLVNKPLDRFFDKLWKRGLDYLPELIRINAAMKAERQQYLGVASYERSKYAKYKPGFYPVAISPDNTKLIFSYSLEPGSHIAKVYSIPDGVELYRIASYFATFFPDGSVIAASVGNSRNRSTMRRQEASSVT